MVVFLQPLPRFPQPSFCSGTLHMAASLPTGSFEVLLGCKAVMDATKSAYLEYELCSMHLVRYNDYNESK